MDHSFSLKNLQNVGFSKELQKGMKDCTDIANVADVEIFMGLQDLQKDITK